MKAHEASLPDTLLSRMINPRIVELTGPTGVGKSTLIHYLRKACVARKNWILAEDLLREIKPSGWIYPHLDKMAGMRFYKRYPEYKPLFREVQRENIISDSFFFRNKRFVQLYKVLCEVQMIEEYFENSGKDDPRLCLYEEGIVFKSFSRVDISVENPLFRAYAESFPLPSSIIHLNAPSEAISSRAWSREKTAPVHYNLDKDEITEDIRQQKKRTKSLHELMNQLGINIHYISMTKSPEVVVPEFTELMNQLADTGSISSS